jgi:hypothetical protein
LADGAWLETMKLIHARDVGEDFIDECCLGVGVGLAVVAMLLGKLLFEALVACGDRRIGSQGVPKLQPAKPRFAAEDDQVEVMSPPAQGVPHQPAPVRQGGVKLGGSLVAVRAQRLQQSIGLVEAAHSSQDVDDRLGGESRNGGAADMFDGDEPTRQEIQKTISFVEELCCPLWVVRGKTHLFGDGSG